MYRLSHFEFAIHLYICQGSNKIASSIIHLLYWSKCKVPGPIIMLFDFSDHCISLEKSHLRLAEKKIWTCQLEIGPICLGLSKTMQEKSNWLSLQFSVVTPRIFTNKNLTTNMFYIFTGPVVGCCGGVKSHRCNIREIVHRSYLSSHASLFRLERSHLANDSETS